jgi:hypothetical protein
MKGLRENRVLLTGSTSDMGKSIGNQFSQEGAWVTIT